LPNSSGFSLLKADIPWLAGFIRRSFSVVDSSPSAQNDTGSVTLNEVKGLSGDQNTSFVQLITATDNRQIVTKGG